MGAEAFMQKGNVVTYKDIYLAVKRIKTITHRVILSCWALYWLGVLIVCLAVITYLSIDPSIEKVETADQYLSPYILWFNANISEPFKTVSPSWLPEPIREDFLRIVFALIGLMCLLLSSGIEFFVKSVGVAFGWIENDTQV